MEGGDETSRPSLQQTRRDDPPPVLEYRSPSDEKPVPWPRLLGWRTAALIIGICAAIGLVPNSQPPVRTEFLVFPIYLASLWYVAARAADSRAPLAIRVIKTVLGVISMAIAPFVLCGDAWLYAQGYGWTHPLAFGNRHTLFLLVSVSSFGVADVVDWVIRWRRSHRSKLE